MPRPDYLGPYPDVYVGGQRLWKVFAGSEQVWPEGFEPMWVCYGTRGGSNPAFILYSGDGETWARVDIDIPIRTLQSTSLSQHSIAVDPLTNTFLVSENSQKIWKSTDGETWTSSNIPSGRNVNSVSYGNGVWIVGMGIANAYHAYGISTDAENWTENNLPRNLGVAADEISINHYTSSARLLSSLQRRFRSTDNGTTWSDSSPLLRRWAVASDGSGTILSNEGTGALFYRSTDGGATWSSVSSIANVFSTMFDASLTYADGVWIYTGASSSTDRVWKSTDNGSTWTGIDLSFPTGGASVSPRYRSAHDSRNGEWVVSGTNTSDNVITFWKSVDNTATWQGPFQTGFVGRIHNLIHNSGLPDTKLP